MTGTSLDGLDAALTRITGTGLAMTAEFVGMVNAPLPDGLRSMLRSLAAGEPHPPIEIMRAARHLGAVHAEAVAELLSVHPEAEPDYVVAHGQTVWHAPADRLSWQLFDPWPIVRVLGLPVCYDLRQADLIAGGEGAPITPIADWVMYRHHADAVMNLGGIANATWLHEEIAKVKGEDIFPCNILLDGLYRAWFDGDYDRDGVNASNGEVDIEVVGMISEAVSTRIQTSRSLGREYFDDLWIQELADSVRRKVSPEGGLISAIGMISACGMGLVKDKGCKRVVLAGGGAKNHTLTDGLASFATEIELCYSDDVGIPGNAREAMGFAVLGALSTDGIAVSLPQVTGANEPGAAGVWAYPDGPPGGAAGLGPAWI
ncbi:MAG: anhydro-N-acetylmuramic acid kinase [Planctomycetota bacterium]